MTIPDTPSPESEHVMNTTRRHLSRPWKLALVALATVWTQTANAHHSFGKFDMGKLTTLSGTVREFTWANPHTWLIVIVKRANGTTEQWALVGSSPNMMSRWGWNAADIKVGDKVVVDVHPGRDGTPIGSLQTVFLTNGKVLADPAGSTGQALAGGPGHLPTKPQGQPYK
ncbi:DUF6152 family protein [Novosphingobium sp.]|uniref:DUF6152 family protein n=1 Tax=Novosphingobium sp. TaxID=1874826 RepID=UPI00333EDFB6